MYRERTDLLNSLAINAYFLPVLLTRKGRILSCPCVYRPQVTFNQLSDFHEIRQSVSPTLQPRQVLRHKFVPMPN